MRFLGRFTARSNLVPSSAEELSAAADGLVLAIFLSRIQDHEEDLPKLEIDFIFQAPSPDSAQTQFEQLTELILDALSFVYSARFEEVTHILLVEWDEASEELECAFFSPPFPRIGGAMLTEDLIETVTPILGPHDQGHFLQAVAWLRAALEAKRLDHTFTCTWLALEITATTLADRSKIIDRCLRCGGNLSCEDCGKISEHRPFDRDLIRSELQKLEMPGDIIDMFFRIRNMLSHGATDKQVTSALRGDGQSEFDFSKSTNLFYQGVKQLVLSRFGKLVFEDDVEIQLSESAFDTRIRARFGARIKSPKNLGLLYRRGLPRPKYDFEKDGDVGLNVRIDL